jgi:short-subunit dehydrogenase
VAEPTARSVALVTGASSGIGEALARRIARDGRHLVLTARRLDRLQALARELETAYGISAVPIANDLARPGSPRELAEEVERRGLVVDWLVNNAGFGTAGRFDSLPVERELDEIRVNVKAPVALTGLLLPAMVARGHGVIMNVSSMAGFGPMPFTATYAATKAFLLSFSEALAVELSGTGVHVLCVCPGFTRTEFQEKAKIDASVLPSLAWMSAETVADQAVRAAGRSGVLVNGTLNSLTTVFMRLAPRSLVARVAAAGMRGRV